MHPEVEDLLVLDHGKNTKRHGFFEDEISWTLDITTKDAEEVGARPTIECPQCQAIYRGGQCKNCGYEPTPRQREAQGLEWDGGEMVEISRKERAKPKEKSAEELIISALYMAGRSGRTWRQACGIYYKLGEKHNGRKMRIPKYFTVGGITHSSIAYDDPNGNRRVEALYEFTRI